MPDAPSPAALTRADRGEMPPKTKAEREEMLAGVENMIRSLVSKSGLPVRDREDNEQEIRLLAWGLTESFDPSRGVRWATYAHVAINRTLKRMLSTQRAKRGAELQLEPAEWNRLLDPNRLYEGDPDETADQLYAAVQRSLTGGLLDALTSAKPGKNAPTPALPGREIVEGVAFRGLTCDDLATQTGQHPKAVKTNLKNALRKLKKKGLTQHVATDAQVEAILVPDPGKKHCNKPRVKRVTPVLPDPMKPAAVPSRVGQEQGCPPDPTEAAPCSTPA